MKIKVRESKLTKFHKAKFTPVKRAKTARDANSEIKATA